MLKGTFEKGLQFTKRNPEIFYSLFLIAAVTGALFFNSYYSLQKFQDTSDALLKSKAVLAENIFRILGSDILKNTTLLQGKLDQIKEELNEKKSRDCFSLQDTSMQMKWQ